MERTVWEVGQWVRTCVHWSEAGTVRGAHSPSSPSPSPASSTEESFVIDPLVVSKFRIVSVFDRFNSNPPIVPNPVLVPVLDPSPDE